MSSDSDPGLHDTSDARTDPARLKGLSHRLRLELFDQLVLHGPATATMLAGRLGESSGATSYHLRQLERHHFIEEDAERGSARERWWRASPGGISIEPSDIIDDPAALEATFAIVSQMTAQRARQLNRFMRYGLEEFGVEWVEGAAITSSVLTLTLDELVVLNREIEAAVARTVAQRRGRDAVPGARRIMVQYNAFPLAGAPAVEAHGVGEESREDS